MWTSELQKIYDEFFPRYKEEIKNGKENNLRREILQSYEEAINRWERVDRPTIIKSKEQYVQHYIRVQVDYFIASKSVKKISTTRPPLELKSSVLLSEVINSPKMEKLKIDFYNQFPESKGFRAKSKQIWKQASLPMESLEEVFLAAIEERNVFVQKKGFSSRVEWAIDRYKIPQQRYVSFIHNLDKVIPYCNRKLPKLENQPPGFYSTFGSHCFVCQQQDFPFNSFDEIVEYVTAEYPLLTKFKEKIVINLENSSMMKYRHKYDDFLITIQKDQNNRHQLLDLLHELSHVIIMFDEYQANRDYYDNGTYAREKHALKVELKLLSKFPQLYQSVFGEFLKVFHSVLFQIELYKNSKQDPSKLYAQVFNRCFIGAHQETNPLWILDDIIVQNPLSNLPHAVAQANLIVSSNNQ